ncbi:hypothetical protein G6F55_014090 [Rhizopus delemar]|nr:hypothetical protein G6F55_014090 [Rhizopus delemar]
MKALAASSVAGMLAPSATHSTPFLISVCASASSSSVCVAHGRATSTGTCHGRLPASYVKPNCLAYVSRRPRRSFLMCIRATSFSCVKPASSTTVPLESDTVTTLAPSDMAFSMA